MPRIQFILKYRDNQYSDDKCGYSHGFLSSGLYNSAKFVQEMLRDILGYETRLDHAIDNNCIDRLVTEYSPDIVIIEAYWVVPEKFEILAKLHPDVVWVIRNHSPTPFAATEGVVVDWSMRYMDYPNVILACNDERADDEFKHMIRIYKSDFSDDDIDFRCEYLPNYYPLFFTPRPPLPETDAIDIGCFGAIRPLKNQLIQAMAAINYAELIGKKLRFHINNTRVEGYGEPILKNLEKLFSFVSPHELVEHSWMTHDDFIALVRTMDIGMQVSYAESFNIVTADMVTNGVPVVTSSEVRWVSPEFHADPNDSNDIVEVLKRAAWVNKELHFLHPNIGGLHKHNLKGIEKWKEFVDTICDQP